MRKLLFSLLIVLSSCGLRSERLENPDFPKENFEKIDF